MITFDGPTKVITLSAGTTVLSVRDLWSRWVDWFLTGDNSKYDIWMMQVGGDNIDESAGTKIPIYVFLASGVQIKPQEANHTLNVTDGILLVAGGGDPFKNTTGSYVVRINYQQPVQAISFLGGDVVTPESVADAVWNEPKADHQVSGSTGEALSDAGGAGNPWSSPIYGNVDPGTFGEFVTKKLLSVKTFLGLK